MFCKTEDYINTALRPYTRRLIGLTIRPYKQIGHWTPTQASHNIKLICSVIQTGQGHT